jgi:hypothetical protein
MIISVELVGIDGVSQRCEIAKVDRSLDGARLNDFGLSLEEAKEIQRRLATGTDAVSDGSSRPARSEVPRL